MKFRLAFVVLFLSPLVACAQTGEKPYRSVRYFQEVRTTPQPQKIYVAAIDLTDPNVRVRVSRGGADPDGPGKWTTTLMRPTRVADREGFDVVINGDFFSHLSGRDAEGAAALKEFKGSTPAAVTGPAITDGVVWTPGTKEPRPAFMIDKSGKPAIAMITNPPSDAFELISGHDLLVKGGKNVAPPNPPTTKPNFIKGPHPRTAVGIANHGKVLLMVVIDGRKKGEAIGMSLSEVAQVMLKYGATDAMNLDGGGSSVLAIRDPQTGKMQIKNKPSDGAERPVGNVLGVRVRPPGATTQPAAAQSR